MSIHGLNITGTTKQIVSVNFFIFFSEVIMLELVPEETSKNSEKSWGKFEQNVLRKTRDELKEQSWTQFRRKFWISFQANPWTNLAGLHSEIYLTGFPKVRQMFLRDCKRSCSKMFQTVPHGISQKDPLTDSLRASPEVLPGTFAGVSPVISYKDVFRIPSGVPSRVSPLGIPLSKLRWVYHSVLPDFPEFNLRCHQNTFLWFLQEFH